MEIPGARCLVMRPSIAREQKDLSDGRYVHVRLESRHLTDSRFCLPGIHGLAARVLRVKRAADP